MSGMEYAAESLNDALRIDRRIKMWTRQIEKTNSEHGFV
jgi:hypothetical protein